MVRLLVEQGADINGPSTPQTRCSSLMVAVAAAFGPPAGTLHIAVPGVAFAVTVLGLGAIDRDDLAFVRRVLSRSSQPSAGALVPEVS